MTNPKIPEWFQAAIAKLNEEYNEKRQIFEERADPYYDGFADGLDIAETIFTCELMRASECADSHKITSTNQNDRNQFEAEYGSDGLTDYHFEKRKSGVYVDLKMETLFMVWQLSKNQTKTEKPNNCQPMPEQPK